MNNLQAGTCVHCSQPVSRANGGVLRVDGNGTGQWEHWQGNCAYQGSIIIRIANSASFGPREGRLFQVDGVWMEITGNLRVSGEDYSRYAAAQPASPEKVSEHEERLRQDALAKDAERAGWTLTSLFRELEHVPQPENLESMTSLGSLWRADSEDTDHWDECWYVDAKYVYRKVLSEQGQWNWVDHCDDPGYYELDEEIFEHPEWVRLERTAEIDALLARAVRK